MSYHLAMRSLQISACQTGVGKFADCIEHSLVGDQPAPLLKQQMLRSDSRRVSLLSISERMGELLAVDLNPLGQVFRLANSEITIAKAWDAYNENGNVVSKVGFEGRNAADALDFKDSKADARAILSTHEKLRSGLHWVLLNQIRKNHDESVRARKIEDLRVSALCRIYGVDQLILELSEYFEEYPKAKVSDACQRLSIHPRFLERRLLEFGLSAVKIKRACMLAYATREILWSNKNFNDIARSAGYSHGAHLSHAVHAATGGMSPSLIRGIMRV